MVHRARKESELVSQNRFLFLFFLRNRDIS